MGQRGPWPAAGGGGCGAAAGGLRDADALKPERCGEPRARGTGGGQKLSPVPPTGGWGWLEGAERSHPPCPPPPPPPPSPGGARGGTARSPRSSGRVPPPPPPRHRPENAPFSPKGAVSRGPRTPTPAGAQGGGSARGRGGGGRGRRDPGGDAAPGDATRAAAWGGMRGGGGGG